MPSSSHRPLKTAHHHPEPPAKQPLAPEQESEAAQVALDQPLAFAAPLPPPVSGANRTRLMLQLQRTHGNAHVQRMVARAHPVPPLIQRADPAPAAPAAPAAPDKNEAMIQALNLANKNSATKIKLAVKPPGTVSGGLLELKKAEVEFDVTSEVSSPDVANAKSSTKASGGVSNTKASESDLKKQSLTETQSKIYAADIQSKFGTWAPAALQQAASWKVSGEHDPGNASKVKAGVGFDTDLVSGELSFNFLSIDLTKKDPKERFKPMTVGIKLGTGKILEKSFPGALTIDGKKVDIKTRVKISGSIEVGPNWEKLGYLIAKKFGKETANEFFWAALTKVADEEAQKSIEKAARELAAEACKDISDPVAKQYALDFAERKVLEEAEKRGLKTGLKEAVEKAGMSMADATAARIALKEAAEAGARVAVREIGPSVLSLIAKEIGKLTVKNVVQRIALAMAGGPADLVLIGGDILYHYFDTIVKDQELKQIGLKAQIMRDNYVAGYVAGLRGNAKGVGQSGGAGNDEGGAYLVGLQDGTQQFNQYVDSIIQGEPGADRAIVIEEVASLMAMMEIDRSGIMAKATPKIKQALINAYAKTHTGLLDKILGTNPLEGKDFENFQNMIDTNLAVERSGTTATLANGVTLKLIALDSTSDRAQIFRTQDGRVVKQGGDTQKYSGWITAAEGTPLEEIYTSSEQGNESNKSGPDFIAKMKQQLAASSVTLLMPYVHTSNAKKYSIQKAYFTAASADPAFRDFLRSSAVLGMTLGEAGCAISIRTNMNTQTSTSLDEKQDFDQARSVIKGMTFASLPPLW